MGPLWAWVVLWLVSAYGLVFLLRLAMASRVVEPVPVLVATPEPVASPPEGAAIASEETAVAEAAPESGEVADGEASRQSAKDPDPDGPGAPGEAETLAHESWTQERRVTEAAEPWIKETEEAAGSEPWIKERPETFASEPWIKEPEAGLESVPFEETEADEPLAVTSARADEAFEDQSVEYRAIDLGSLTLGLEASEVQGLYGLPGHVSKVGPDGEQWRYPLNATDERGEGVHGVLVLEFQRGRLVRKALEEGEAEG